MLAYNQPIGRMARLPLKAIPKRAVIPILSGPNRGLKWIAGSSVHGCWIGWYEKACADYIAAVAKPGMIAFDVGANVGYYTLLLARRVSRVIAFEPNQANVFYLREHLRLNDIRNVEVVEAAVAESNGTGLFSGAGPTGQLSERGATIRTVRLDDYPVPDFIKMDIEGGEAAALKGATKILTAQRANWLVELHGEAGRGATTFLESRGYAIERLVSDTIKAIPASKQFRLMEWLSPHFIPRH